MTTFTCSWGIGEQALVEAPNFARAHDMVSDLVDDEIRVRWTDELHRSHGRRFRDGKLVAIEPIDSVGGVPHRVRFHLSAHHPVSYAEMS